MYFENLMHWYLKRYIYCRSNNIHCLHLMGIFPYLIFSLIFLFLFAVGLLITPLRFRRSVLISAALSAPTSLATFVFVPYYWNPERIVPFELGPEDIFFSFSSGGIIWLFVILVLTRNYSITINHRVSLLRYGMFIFFGCLIYMVCLLTKMRIMLATVFTILVIGIWILSRCWCYRRISIIGTLGFAIIYVTFLKGFMAVCPEFLEHWSMEYLYGIMLIGLPLEEIIWATATGAVWPLIMSYLFNLQLVKKEKAVSLSRWQALLSTDTFKHDH